MASGGAAVMLRHTPSAHNGDSGGVVSRGRGSSCECCPYGYHIDLDFVRYCEAFNKSSGPGGGSKLRQRRRQRHSMEVLLGLTSPTVWQIEQQLPQVPQEEDEEHHPPPVSVLPPTPESSALLRDALYKAVLDFEDTLQKSKRRPSPCRLTRDEFNPPSLDSALLCELHVQPGSLLRRSASTSSLASSLSEDSAQPPRVTAALLYGADSDVASVESAASATSTAALQNIREQMAKSLEKMREMESKVKLIPILQSQVSALKEEKRLMLLQLREASERQKVHSEVSSPAPTRTGDEPSSSSSSSSRVVKRDVGVECGVVTRDVGITHAGPKLRSIATQSQANNLSFGAVRSETIPPEPPFLESAPTPAPEVARAHQVKVAVLDHATNTTPPDTRHVGCGTELRMNQIYSAEEVEVLLDTHVKKITREEEAARARRRVDRGVLAKPRCSDSAVSATPRTRDCGSSEHSINDILCDKCNVRKKSIGVGSAGFLRPPGEDGLASLSSITMTRSKSSDSFNLRSRLLRPSCAKSTDTRDLRTFRDTAVNTMKRKLVDAAAGDRLSTRDESVQCTTECTKCQQKEEAPPPPPCAKCQGKGESPPPPQARGESPSYFSPLSTLSRIPRLAKPAPSQQPPPPPSPGTKRPFKRQDTYTKLGVEQAVPTIEIEVTPVESSPVLPKGSLSETRLLDAAVAASSSSSNNSSGAGALPSREDDLEHLEHLESHVESQEDEEEEPHPLYAHGSGALLAHNTARKKADPSKEMRGAMKVLSDSLKKSPRSEVPPQLKNAVNMIQQEWFKISSTATANPLDVEDYLDCFEEISGQLLEHIVNMTDNSGNTAMHYAVSHGNFDVVSILLDSKVCDINQANQAGYTSVMLVSLAQMRSDTDSHVVQRLFQLADVNVRAKQHGQTALMLAASHGRLCMANMLLAAGADVNIQDDDGSTALMCAAEHGHVEMVRLLLAQPDCEVSATDHDGSTALNIAMEAGHRDVGVLLYAHQHFSSRGSSPYSSLKPRRPKS